MAVTIGALAAPSVFAAYDGTLTFTGLGGGNANNGGAFNVSTTPSVGTPNLGNFSTFCIEKNEFISIPSQSYAYKINTGAVAGGIGGLKITDPNTGLPMDNISIGTAFLFSQFRAGAVGYTSDTAKSQLQVAIWYLEGEITSQTFGGVNGGNFVTLATTAATLAGKAVTDDSAGAYGVVALNLFNDANHNGIYDTGDTALQDQLAIVPEASTITAGALLLLPFGVSVIRILRKNRVA